MEIQSRESCCRIHYHPVMLGRESPETRQGDAGRDSLERYGRGPKNRAHLNGVGDSERKCAISPRTSHHFSLELHIMPSWKNHIKNVFSCLYPIANILPAALHAETI